MNHKKLQNKQIVSVDRKLNEIQCKGIVPLRNYVDDFTCDHLSFFLVPSKVGARKKRNPKNYRVDKSF